ncbi:hypothetical protein J5N97_009004 [Dioscorea zingiberensis]|uniref:GDP-L-galactose phosphorylase 1 n=1 Tax=Dioscorea zingiberensis TaxID=325984 RepID=A0A9D5HL99_9LILI|nr:hypothetical protein J5N97_009004 [Dioscorea zingiberensis]
MVSVKQLESAYSFLKLNSTEQLKWHIMALKGSNAPLYRLKAPLSEEAGAFGEFSSNAEEGQNLLGTLLLAQWEDRAWKGQLKYDVTSCETKVISGGMKFIAQLNEQWSSNSLALFENTDIQPLGSSRMTNVKICRDNILLCITRGESESPELIPSAVLPREGTLVFVNANPIEYGHIYVVPYKCGPSEVLDKVSLEYISQIAVEVDDCFFRMFYEYAPSTNSCPVYFQANFFAGALPVELLELIPVYGDSFEKGLQILEVAQYPIKTLLFTSKENPKLLAGVVSEICSVLQEHNAVFSLLITDNGRKFFLFPQVQSSSTVCHLSAWECGGYFIFNKVTEFEHTSEEEISNRLASVSLDDEGFQALKQLCCCIANKVVVP